MLRIEFGGGRFWVGATSDGLTGLPLLVIQPSPAPHSVGTERTLLVAGNAVLLQFTNLEALAVFQNALNACKETLRALQSAGRTDGAVDGGREELNSSPDPEC